MPAPNAWSAQIQGALAGQSRRLQDFYRTPGAAAEMEAVEGVICRKVVVESMQTKEFEDCLLPLNPDAEQAAQRKRLRRESTKGWCKFPKLLYIVLSDFV